MQEVPQGVGEAVGAQGMAYVSCGGVIMCALVCTRSPRVFPITEGLHASLNNLCSHLTITRGKARIVVIKRGGHIDVLLNDHHDLKS